MCSQQRQTVKYDQSVEKQLCVPDGLNNDLLCSLAVSGWRLLWKQTVEGLGRPGKVTQ